MESDTDSDRVLFDLDTAIVKYQTELQTLGILEWKAFLALKDSQKKNVLRGDTIDDYLKDDFKNALAQRLNAREKRHFLDLGNIAIHSSAFLLFFPESKVDSSLSLVAEATCLNLFHGSRHLALCGLEMIRAFPELNGLIDSKTRDKWKILALSITKEGYLD